MALVPLPATTRAYWTRANVPFTATANTTDLNGFNLWAMAMVLCDLISTGTASGTRSAGSIWNHRGSSDGAGAFTAIGAAGSSNSPNRWYNAGAYPGLVKGSNGSNHHWILLENTTLGMELMLNFSQNADSGYVCWSAGKSGAFSGGTANTCPNASAGVTSFQLGQVAYSAGDGGQIAAWVDSTFGSTFRGHITVAPNGEFWWAASRGGSGCFCFFGSLWVTTGQQAGDPYNQFLLGQSNGSTGRGTAIAGYLEAQAFCSSRAPGGAQAGAGGLVLPRAGGSAIVTGLGTDALSGAYNAVKLDVWQYSPQYVRRGTLPDWYACGTEAVGAPIPAAGAGQERVVIGDLILPCMVVQPLV